MGQQIRDDSRKNGGVRVNAHVGHELSCGVVLRDVAQGYVSFSLSDWFLCTLS